MERRRQNGGSMHWELGINGKNSKKVALTRMLGGLAVVWEGDYWEACKPSGEGDRHCPEAS